MPKRPVGNARSKRKAVSRRRAATLVGHRLGSFVEFVGEDGLAVSRSLGIVVSWRGTVAMCGIPAGPAGTDRIKRLRLLGDRVRVVGAMNDRDKRNDVVPASRRGLRRISAAPDDRAVATCRLAFAASPCSGVLAEI